MDKDFEVVIAGACRTPIGAFGGAFRDLGAVDLGAIAIREAIARTGVKPEDVGDTVMGCVLQAGAGMNVARQAGLKAGLPVSVPGETVKNCDDPLVVVVLVKSNVALFRNDRPITSPITVTIGETATSAPNV